MPCNYKTIKYVGNIKGYKCYVNSKFEVKARETSVNGIIRKNPDGYPQPSNYEDPSILEMKVKLVNYIPKGFDIFFRNLQTLNIIGCELLEVKQEDMKVFPNLKLLNLEHNKIKILEKDLFKFNPDLEGIMFGLNRIQYIHPNIADHLTKLNLLDFGGNDCIHMVAFSRSEVLNKIVDGIKTECQKYGELEKSKNIKKSGTERGKYFWILVGCGVIVGVFSSCAFVRIVVGIFWKA